MNDASSSPDVKTRIASILDEGALSQSQLAKETGVSASAISYWLKGKYTGDSSAVEEKLSRWLAMRDRRNRDGGTMPAPPNWIETPTAARIMPALTYAQLAGDIACIYGGAGVGKTETLRHYAETAPNVWVSTMSPDIASVSGCLEEVAYDMGLREFRTSGAAVYRREICRRVSGTGGLLIVDEAQHLTLAALEALRRIHDTSGIGLALCGNEAVYSRLSGDGRRANFAQLFSRIGKRLRIVRPLKADVVSVANAYGVTGKDEIKVLHGIAVQPGALRGVVKTLRLACMVAGGAGDAVNEKHLNRAWKELAGTGGLAAEAEVDR